MAALTEQGFPLDAQFRIGALAPAETPPAAISARSARLHKAVANLVMQKKLQALDMPPQQDTQPESTLYIGNETPDGKVVCTASIRIDD